MAKQERGASIPLTTLHLVVHELSKKWAQHSKDTEPSVQQIMLCPLHKGGPCVFLDCAHACFEQISVEFLSGDRSSRGQSPSEKSE